MSIHFYGDRLDWPVKPRVHKFWVELAMGTEFCMVVANIYGLSVWNFMSLFWCLEVLSGTQSLSLLLSLSFSLSLLEVILCQN